MSAAYKLLLGITLICALTACKKEGGVELTAPPPPPSEPVVAILPSDMPAAIEVSAVQLGTQVDEDGKVESPATRFAPGDAVYVAVDTKNAGKDARLSIRWASQDGKVNLEEQLSISPASDTTTHFKMTDRAPWPVGKYALLVSLNGVPAKSLDFEIK